MIKEEKKHPFDQYMELWFIPEIKKRQAAGTAESPFKFSAGQVIFRVGKDPIVRLNNEVRLIGGGVKYKDGIEKKKGDPIYAHEVEEIGYMTLPDDEDPNCGHATLMSIMGTWTLSFNFIYNRGYSRSLLEKANQFLNVAKDAQSKGHFAPFIDNLFSASELAARAFILGEGNAQYTVKGSHQSTHRRFNLLGHIGMVDMKYTETFNKLFKLREPARYRPEEVKLEVMEQEIMIEHVKDLIEIVGKRVNLES